MGMLDSLIAWTPDQTNHAKTCQIFLIRIIKTKTNTCMYLLAIIQIVCHYVSSAWNTGSIQSREWNLPLAIYFFFLNVFHHEFQSVSPSPYKTDHYVDCNLDLVFTRFSEKSRNSGWAQKFVLQRHIWKPKLDHLWYTVHHKLIE